MNCKELHVRQYIVKLFPVDVAPNTITNAYSWLDSMF